LLGFYLILRSLFNLYNFLMLMALFIPIFINFWFRWFLLNDFFFFHFKWCLESFSFSLDPLLFQLFFPLFLLFFFINMLRFLVEIWWNLTSLLFGRGLWISLNRFTSLIFCFLLKNDSNLKYYA
jgi:hypothetical protein